MIESSFLTRMEINPRRRSARRYLGSPQVMHAAVEAAFPASTAGERRLWRVDHVSEATWLYVVSRSRPDLTHLVEDIGRPTIASWETKDYAPFLEQLEAGQAWAFRLTANPVHSGRRKPGEDTQRFGHLTATQQEDWLARRLGKWGLAGLEVSEDVGDETTSTVQVVGREVIQFGHRDNDQRRSRITLTRASYEGLVRVVDADKLRAALTKGVGHAKAYGCGLMTLAKP